ncbi:NAD(P)-dependent oxidoreductase [Alicyclobacillaceae bacterium I2511]|nr:NAD(P)-dependent oxidoreductase [Alicyclobacillaceae bacterium I2511]
MSIYQLLRDRELAGSPVRVGVCGAGQMGKGMIAQITHISGMRVTAVCDVIQENAERARDAYLHLAKSKNDVFVTSSYAEMVNRNDLDVVVDATGVPEVGASLALESLIARKHLVMLNVEADVTIGPLLNQLYKAAGLVFTGSAGDEPGATFELFEFAKTLGLEIVVAGKGKNNPFIPQANPDTCANEASQKRMNAHMLAAFQDGTKTMAEMNLLSNATGLVPDVVGTHGVTADVKTVAEKLCLETEGGVLSRYGVVEYVHGLAPGVFIIIRSDLEAVNEELQYLRVGVGPNYTLYRPYHLASLETPLSVARAALMQEPTIVALGAPISETVAVAKRDVKSGEKVDGIGGYSVRGVIETHGDAMTNGHVPIGIVGGSSVAKRNISNGSFLTYDDIEIDENTQVWHLRQLQEKHFS